MAATVTLKVEGLKTIEAALEELPRAVQTDVLAEALTAGGNVLKVGIAQKIKSRTGRTAADLRTEVQVKPNELAGVIAVGASADKKGRSFVLRFLERGTKPHVEPKKKKGQKVKVTLGGVTRTRRFAPDAMPKLAFGGRVYSRIKHPGTHAQAPMRQTIADQGPAAVAAFSRTAWQGITRVVERMRQLG